METSLQIEQSKLHHVVEKILLRRNITPDLWPDFFSWNLRDLPDLTQLKDIEKAANRIILGIEKKETIAIYGDYDVDGTTSCALFYEFFQLLDINVQLFQPSRFVEGYGIHPSSVDNAIEKKVTLLISVDCGITNCETADYAKEKNVDLIITDHHKDICENMPNAYAVVNPNRRDEPSDSPLTALAGVGVAFAICLQIKKLLEAKGKTVPSIYPLLQHVAIGTICDMAKLNFMNLKLTRHGLKQIICTTYSGVACFFNDEDRKTKFIGSEKISFYVGPLINSKGRLDHPEKALNLLIAKNHKEAFENYSHLELSNRERKIIQAKVFDEAKQQVIKNLKNSHPLINIVYSPDWHQGVIGIVASKLVETFEVPAIVFCDSEDKGLIKASCRSAGELDLFSALNSCEDLFLKFGGHKAAAGLSMKKENLNAVKQRLHDHLSEIPEIERTVQNKFDIEISFNDINKQLVTELESMEPFGMGNNRPVFRMKDCIIDSFTILKDIHVKWTFVHKNNPKIKIGGISFSFIGKW
ncbi:MAG: single-stranded-DNA-specific exonuclease RecJ, partial [Halobacteriovoraceae bacterium]|nr:single-stranded-DNA-specific exonuclease RecJ [Halobacteriovoraceae bacterium]